MGWFSYETLRRITRAHPEHEFYFLFDRPFDKEFLFSENIRPFILPPQARHAVLWFLWLEYSVHRFLKKNPVDLFVSPDGFIPLRSGVKTLPVIHDINFFHRPKDLPVFGRLYYNYFFPRFARSATRIGTVSEYSAKDICSSYDVDPAKVDYFHNGVNNNFVPMEEAEKKKIRKRISGGRPYFIFIGTLHPRKNVGKLLNAYDIFRKKSLLDIKLVIVGEKLFLTGEIKHALKQMQYRKDVIFTGRLNREELMKVLSSSLALGFVPYFEGFGIPVIEAMQCGVPVIASNVTSLPEVGGDAVLYSDPDDVEAISENMKALAENDGLREQLIKKGSERVKKFRWDNTADKFWKTIEKALNES